MDHQENFYKNSSTGEILAHHKTLWDPRKSGKLVLFHEFYVAPMTSYKAVEAAPDLLGFVPISKKFYQRLLSKFHRQTGLPEKLISQEI